MAGSANDITPEQQLDLVWDYIKGFHAVHLIAIGVELGLFDRLDDHPEGVASADLAAALGLNPRYVDVWCKTAYAYRLLEADDRGRFRFAPFMEQLLADKRSPRYVAPYAVAAAGFYTDDLRRYPEFFKSGAVRSFQDHGADFSAQIGVMIAGFHTVIAHKLLPSVPGLADKLAAGAKLLDMGCGAGGLVIRLAKAHPPSICVGVDVDAHGIAQAQANIAAAGLSERVRAERIDGGAIGYENEFDAVTLCEVLHEIAVEARPQVIANCHRALKPGAPLFILDETYPSTLAESRERDYGFAVQTAFNELIWGNVVPTAPEQNALLAEAGFERIERAQIATYFTAITAWKS